MTLSLRGCGLGIGLLLACAGNAGATTITPTVFTDDLATNGNCTLREAVQAANSDTKVDLYPAGSGADVIKLAGGTYNLSLTAGSPEDANASGDLDITQPLTIQGAGATIDAHAIDRAIDVLPNAPATIQDLTVTGGQPGIAINSAGSDGGAIRAQSALALTNVNVTHSSAGNALTVIIVIGPGAPGPPGDRGGDGGGVWSDAPLTITAAE